MAKSTAPARKPAAPPPTSTAAVTTLPPPPAALAPLDEHADGLPATCCRVCGSDQRGPYVPTREPLEHDGKRIRWLRTTCGGCGQVRVDRFEEEAPAHA